MPPLLPSADRLDGFVAGLFAAAALLRAKAAVIVAAGVLLAFLCTEAAGKSAGFQHRHEGLLVRPGSADRNRPRGNAQVGAVEIEANALSKLRHHLFGETGVRA